LTRDPLLEQFLSERDLVCPGCSYNLRGLKSDRCPECGDELELSLKLVEPRQAPLIAGLVGLSAGAGLGGLLVIYAIIITIVMGRGRQLLGEFLVTNLIGFAAHAVVILLWVRYWHRIRRMGPAKRWLLVAFCWTMPLTFLVVFSMTIR
jgi:hypothetical protein